MDKLKEYLQQNKDQLDTELVEASWSDEIIEKIKVVRVDRKRVIFRINRPLAAAIAAALILVSALFNLPYHSGRLSNRHQDDENTSSPIAKQYIPKNRLKLPVLAEKIASKNGKYLKYRYKSHAKVRQADPLVTSGDTETDLQIKNAFDHVAASEQWLSVFKEQYAELLHAQRSISQVIAKADDLDTNQEYYQIISQQKSFLLKQLHDQIRKNNVYVNQGSDPQSDELILN